MARGGSSQAVIVQGRVLLALILREARTRYSRHRIGYLWAVFEPLLHISVFYLLWRFRLRTVPLGDSIFMFLATGFTTYFGFRNVMGRTSGGYGSNEALLSYPIVSVMDVFLGRALLELATWITVTILIYSGGIILTGAGLPVNVLKMLTAILALFAIGFGFGVMLGVVTEFFPSVGNLMKAPLRLLYIFSGVFFLPDTMPSEIRDTVIAWNPVAHGIILLREGYYQGYDSSIFDAEYLSAWAIGSLFLGFVAEKMGRKPMRSVI